MFASLGNLILSQKFEDHKGAASLLDPGDVSTQAERTQSQVWELH